MKGIQGKVEFKKLPSEDLLDAVKTIKGNSTTGISHPQLGIGPARQIAWATADIAKASESTDAEEQERCSVNALLHARRGLACLVDSYLLRDGLSLCKGFPKESDEKNKLLIRRKILDKTSSDVLLDAIYLRNDIEHKYQAVSFSVARTFVALIRHTVESLRHKSNPADGPCYFGSIGHGSSNTHGNITFAFYGWHGHGCIMATYARPAWIGIVDPTSKGKAEIRRAFLHDVKVETLLDVLDVLEGNFKDRSTFLSPILWDGIGRESGMS